jgi:2-(3-amino-3-carboxypropyl)histidine synthase
MDNAAYDFETDRVIKEVRKKKAKRIGLQFPEGLKAYAIEIAGKIEKETGTQTVIFTDPVYGACDTKEKDAQLLRLDMIIHFGHTNLAPNIRRK